MGIRGGRIESIWRVAARGKPGSDDVTRLPGRFEDSNTTTAAFILTDIRPDGHFSIKLNAFDPIAAIDLAAELHAARRQQCRHSAENLFQSNTERTRGGREAGRLQM